MNTSLPLKVALVLIFVGVGLSIASKVGLRENQSKKEHVVDHAAMVEQMKSCLTSDLSIATSEAEINQVYRRCWNGAELKGKLSKVGL